MNHFDKTCTRYDYKTKERRKKQQSHARTETETVRVHIKQNVQAKHTMLSFIWLTNPSNIFICKTINSSFTHKITGMWFDVGTQVPHFGCLHQCIWKLYSQWCCVFFAMFGNNFDVFVLFILRRKHAQTICLVSNRIDEFYVWPQSTIQLWNPMNVNIVRWKAKQTCWTIFWLRYVEPSNIGHFHFYEHEESEYRMKTNKKLAQTFIFSFHD